MKKKDTSLTIRLSSDTKADIKSSARDLERSTNWLVVHIIETWLARRSRKRSRR